MGRYPKIKACPFCGEDVAQVCELDCECGCKGGNKWRAVCCPVCGTQGPRSCNNTGAIKGWNIRTCQSDVGRKTKK